MNTQTVKTITLLRHGISTANYEGIAQGQQDYPLHSLGIEQAERLATYWKNTHQEFEQIITSPLKRARDTARIIGAALSIPILEDPQWVERNFGEGEGLTYEQIEEMFSSQKVRWTNFEPIFVNSETEQDLIERASVGIDSLLELDTSNLLLVSHGGILNAALCSILGIPLSKSTRPPGFAFDNTGYTRLIYHEKTTRWIIRFHNASPHLE